MFLYFSYFAGGIPFVFKSTSRTLLRYCKAMAWVKDWHASNARFKASSGHAAVKGVQAKLAWPLPTVVRSTRTCMFHVVSGHECLWMFPLRHVSVSVLAYDTLLIIIACEFWQQYDPFNPLFIYVNRVSAYSHQGDRVNGLQQTVARRSWLQ